MPAILNSVPSVINALTLIDQASVCIGNPDDTFKTLVAAREGVFRNASGKHYMHAVFNNSKSVWHFNLGTEVVAKVEEAITGTSTIRHSMCELLISPGKKSRCGKCEAHRKSLLVMLKRHMSADGATKGTDPTSHVNYRYLSSDTLSERCNNLHKSFVASQRKILRMQQKIQKLTAAHAVTVDANLNDDLKTIMKENFTAISAQYPEATFERMFWEQHGKTMSCKDRRGFRWHPAMIKWCLYLRHLSSSCHIID